MDGRSNFKTDQEGFWAGSFGVEYIERNRSSQMLASNINFFAHALKIASKLGSCIEFGANIGMNLKALKLLYPEIQLHALEINQEAIKQLKEELNPEKVYCQSILDYMPAQKFDLVLVKGLLIHIDPDVLPDVYDKLISSMGKYLLLAEYYNPTPVKISYRGHDDRLFKRDFSGEILESYPNIRLLDYGFVYRRDPNFPQDDINWFLLSCSLV